MSSPGVKTLKTPSAGHCLVHKEHFASRQGFDAFQFPALIRCAVAYLSFLPCSMVTGKYLSFYVLNYHGNMVWHHVHGVLMFRLSMSCTVSLLRVSVWMLSVEVASEVVTRRSQYYLWRHEDVVLQRRCGEDNVLAGAGAFISFCPDMSCLRRQGVTTDHLQNIYAAHYSLCRSSVLHFSRIHTYAGRFKSFGCLTRCQNVRLIVSIHLLVIQYIQCHAWL